MRPSIYSLLLPPKGYFRACCAGTGLQSIHSSAVLPLFAELQFHGSQVFYVSTESRIWHAPPIPGLSSIGLSDAVANTSVSPAPPLKMASCWQMCVVPRLWWRIGSGWSPCPRGRALLALAFIKVFWHLWGCVYPYLCLCHTLGFGLSKSWQGCGRKHVAHSLWIYTAR